MTKSNNFTTTGSNDKPITKSVPKAFKIVTVIMLFIALISQSFFIKHNGDIAACPLGTIIFIILYLILLRICNSIDRSRFTWNSSLLFSVIIIAVSVVRLSPLKIDQRIHQENISRKLTEEAMYYKMLYKQTKPSLCTVATDMKRISAQNSRSTDGYTQSSVRSHGNAMQESVDMIQRYRKGAKAYDGPLSDKLIEGLIEAATPEADEATRRVQRHAAKAMLDPRPGASKQHLDRMMSEAEKIFSK
ncbi:MAG: hypothetical protein JW804_03630 [Sedimentisphaerales bacterium]|nr:hypothetical protein [Sedimentisphaerales bacterium]